jgi:GNAT superfamily N-acetyltransferase
MTKPLTESVLRGLTSEAFVTYLGLADDFVCILRPGWCSVTTGEPVADLNYIVAGHGATESGAFGAACTTFISKRLPFLAILFPGAGPEAAQAAGDLGLVHVVDFPFMVREDAPIDPEGNDSVVVRRAIGAAAAEANAHVLSSGFDMPEDAVRRVLPASLVDAPNVDVFLASIEDDVVGTVTVIHQGDTAGIWSMATTRQRSGIGRRLLSTALAEARRLGARRFFLGATPGGYRLYESMGFATRVVTKVSASGETHQA